MSAQPKIAPDAPVYVYELPVRLWHAVNALSVVVLAVTGYLIAHPLATPEGEASANFLMGYIRFAHFAAAYVFAVGFLGRVYWAFAGNHHARELFIVPVHRPAWWDGLWHELRWFFFLDSAPRRYLGHNPLAQLSMFAAFTLGAVFMIGTGFALYGEGEGQGSWQDRLFGWIIPLFGQSQDVHTWHHLIAWVLVWFVMIHVYIAIREDKMSGQSMLKTIATGWRSFKG
ncbi:Ni/Fe-hydrogenase 1 B-type cytochrome subunit [Methylomagnum ishizawai]|uniref:Ni/Fe-hydrogenase 1 B-type cytochrome subunit n=1 Tax=Methylomagnum ishizawai TaxID=1760988 RepID=A0A1Y6D570_9GAMM|nr:Ni/Fe-hydrogenase, b-type cytochrome subunit [Methylomagnum ishizawai]SMF97517.1 Ni/Fe-hydrogenase 1 B-type cytochrome subunit [Methylomagnum ishizawai]SMF97741.1 Ni/Fe-hydrogenase 1 B-type cytochrome subunit [Methylomagnum ishizawai]